MLHLQCSPRVMERYAQLAGNFMSTSWISKGGTLCTCLFWGAMRATINKSTTCTVQHALTWYGTYMSPYGFHLLILILVLLMAQCNRCNAPLVNQSTCSLNVHWLHCGKSKPMKFRQTAARMSGKVAAQLSKSRGSLSRGPDKVHIIVPCACFEMINHWSLEIEGIEFKRCYYGCRCRSRGELVQ